MTTINAEAAFYGYADVGAPQTVVGSPPTITMDFTSTPPAAGDLLYAWIGWNNVNAIDVATALRPRIVEVTQGWIQMRPEAFYGLQVGFMVFVKVSDGTETAVTIELSTDSTSIASTAWVGGVFSVADSSYGQMDGVTQNDAASTPDIQSITAVNDCIEVACLISVNTGSVAAPGGWTGLGSAMSVGIPGGGSLTGTAAYKAVSAGATAADTWSLVTGAYASAVWTVPAASGRAVPAFGAGNVGDAMGGSEEANGYVLRPDQVNPSPGSYTDPRYGVKAPGQPYRLGRRT